MGELLALHETRLENAGKPMAVLGGGERISLAKQTSLLKLLPLQRENKPSPQLKHLSPAPFLLLAVKLMNQICIN